MTTKSQELATKKTVDEAVDAIVKGMEKLFTGLKEEFTIQLTTLGTEMNGRFDKMEAGMHWIKDDVKGIKEELSTFPSRKQFEELRQKVDSLVS